MTTAPLPYNPPYESPLEDAFAWSLSKYLDRSVSLHKQVECPTICGRFRMDFVAVTPIGYKVAYECDGAQYHDHVRDEWRDAMILGAGDIDTIVRVRGQDIVHRINDVLLISSIWDPQIYSDRGVCNLTRLASSRARTFGASDDPCIAIIAYPDESDSPSSPLHIRLDRRIRVNPPTVQRQFWEAAFRFAQGVGGGKLDDVIEQYNRAR